MILMAQAIEESLGACQIGSEFNLIVYSCLLYIVNDSKLPFNFAFQEKGDFAW